MHEWALAEAIVEAVKVRAVESCRSKFSLLKVRLGTLQQIDKEILSFAINELLRRVGEEQGVHVEKIIFDDEKAVAECLRCGYRWELDLETLNEEYREYVHFIPEIIHAFTSCPKCGFHDFEIVSGRGISIELE